MNNLIRATADIALLIDEGGTIKDVYFGESYISEAPEAWIGRPFESTVTTATRPKLAQLFAEASRKGSSRLRQVNHLLPSGTETPVAYAAVQLAEDEGFLAIGKNMEELATLQQRLVEAQQALEQEYWRLRQAETRYRLLFQRTPEPTLLVDSETLRIVDANPAAQGFLDVPAGALTGGDGRRLTSVIPEEAREDLDQTLQGARERGSDVHAFETELSGLPSRVQISLLPFDPAPLFLVHLQRTDGADAISAGDPRSAPLDALRQEAPDGFLITDASGEVLRANRAFLEMAQLTTEGEARGRSLANWLGRPGADLTVLLSSIERHGRVRLFSTTINGEFGESTDVELSAVGSPRDEPDILGITIRDIGRRLVGRPGGTKDLSRAVEQLTDLVGKTSLKRLVRDTVEMVEAHFIEAALEMTDDNRTAAAELLGVSRQSLYTKLRRYGLEDTGNGDTAS